MKRALAVAALAATMVLVGWAGLGRAGTAGYTITDLGSLGGAPDGTDPHAINSLGQIAGEAVDSAGRRRAFLWSPAATNGATGGMIDLGDLGAGPIAIAQGIDDAGNVVGEASYGTDSHAFWWQSGHMVDLGPGDARAIAAGLAVGDAFGSAETWTGASKSSARSLGTLGGVQAGAIATNGADIAGWRTQPAYPFPQHAVLVGGGSVTDLGTLGGPSSFAMAIDAVGDVAGYSAPDNTTNSHAFLWRPGSGMIDLGTLGYLRGPSSESRAYGMNDVGQVVGESDGFDNRMHAFLWQNGTMTNLDTLLPAGSGWQLERASAINDAGQIVGFGIFNGHRHGYLMTPALATDGTPPVSSAMVGPAPNAAGWNRGPVTIAISAIDEAGGSGVAGITFSASGAQTIASTTVQGPEASVPVAAEGTTTITYHATDNAGNAESDHTLTVQIDETAPVVTVPANGIVADASSTSGAAVAYDVTVKDNLDPAPSGGCSPPSGSQFPIGQTVVTCDASDRAGNTASASFTVTVRGAADQVSDELTATAGGLGSKQQAALADIAGGNLHAACGVLDAYSNEVRAQTGKKLTDGDASALLATVGRVEALLGCQ